MGGDRRWTYGEFGARNSRLGYWTQPEVTAKALCGGWFHTGRTRHYTR
ncbi:hypothetical protein [Streptomyces sp. NPDC088350]